MERDIREPSARRTLRLGSGCELIEQWSEGATQAERNAVHEALFAVAEGRAWEDCMTVGDPGDRHGFFVLLRYRLVLGVRIDSPAHFAVTYVGSVDQAPHLDLWAELPA
jgi:hypothetical protein